MSIVHLQVMYNKYHKIMTFRLLGVALVFFMTCLSVMAGLAMIGPLPASENVDTEVTTNIVFAIDREWCSAVRLILECDVSATNDLEVLIGKDANGDGYLAHEESDISFGYDCGEWFTRSTDPFLLQTIEGSLTGRVRRELRLGSKDIPLSWSLLRVTRRGRISDNEVVILTVDRKNFMMVFR